MSSRTGCPWRARQALLALALTAASLAASAAPQTAATQARAVFERERAACNGPRPHPDRATCLQEAHAAYGEMRRGALATGDPAQLGSNALRRCDALPALHRQDCQARMQGQGSTSGSVAGGGILRELVTRETISLPAAPASAAK